MSFSKEVKAAANRLLYTEQKPESLVDFAAVLYLQEYQPLNLPNASNGAMRYSCYVPIK